MMLCHSLHVKVGEVVRRIRYYGSSMDGCCVWWVRLALCFVPSVHDDTSRRTMRGYLFVVVAREDWQGPCWMLRPGKARCIVAMYTMWFEKLKRQGLTRHVRHGSTRRL